MLNVKKDYVNKTMIFIVIWCSIQDLVLSLCLHYVQLSPSFLNLIVTAKDIVIYFILFPIAFIKVRKYKHNWKSEEIYIFLFIMLCCIYMIIGDAEFRIRLLEFRSFFTSIVLYYIGRCVIMSKEKVIDFNKQMIGLTIFIVVFSIIEYFVIGKYFWSDIIRISDFNYLVKGLGNESVIGESMNMYTAGERRLVGPFGDPLFMSYFCIPLVNIVLSIIFINSPKIYFEVKKSKKWLLIILATLVICLILTISRGPIIAELIAITITLILLKRIKKLFSCIIILTIPLVIFFDKIYDIIYKTITLNDGGSAGMHIYLLENGLEAFKKNIFGSGIGTNGLLAQMSGSEVAIHTENAYLNLGLQIGIFGLVLYIIFWFTITYKNLSLYKNTNNIYVKQFSLAQIITNIAFFVTGFISPQIWTVKSITLFWFVNGIISQMNNDKSILHESENNNI